MTFTKRYCNAWHTISCKGYWQNLRCQWPKILFSIHRCMHLWTFSCVFWSPALLVVMLIALKALNGPHFSAYWLEAFAHGKWAFLIDPLIMHRQSDHRPRCDLSPQIWTRITHNLCWIQYWPIEVADLNSMLWSRRQAGLTTSPLITCK